jgi:hypothetical protein
MPDPQPTLEASRPMDEIERDLLYLLTARDGYAIWTREDLSRELNVRHSGDYLHGLRRAGLVHETSDGHVFASRAGVRAVEITGEAV